MYDHKPISQWTLKTAARKGTTMKADSQRAVGLFREDVESRNPVLLTRVEMSCHVGEERRCFGISTAHEIASELLVVIPQSLRVIGGHDLLRARPEKGRPIPGFFRNLIEADEAATQWFGSFNEIA